MIKEFSFVFTVIGPMPDTLLPLLLFYSKVLKMVFSLTIVFSWLNTLFFIINSKFRLNWSFYVPFVSLDSHLMSVYFSAFSLLNFNALLISDVHKTAFEHPIVKQSLFIYIRAVNDYGFALAAMNKFDLIVRLWSPVDSVQSSVSLSRLHLLTAYKVHKKLQSQRIPTKNNLESITLVSVINTCISQFLPIIVI